MRDIFVITRCAQAISLIFSTSQRKNQRLQRILLKSPDVLMAQFGHPSSVLRKEAIFIRYKRLVDPNFMSLQTSLIKQLINGHGSFGRVLKTMSVPINPAEPLVSFHIGNCQKNVPINFELWHHKK